MQTRSARPLCVHSQIQPDPDWYKKTLNYNDPITMEPVHLARAVFLQKCPKRNRYHAYDADALAKYIESSATRTSPLTRELFSDEELRVISKKSNHPAGYLLAAIEFHEWTPLLPSKTTIESSPVNALITYFEIIANMIEHEKMDIVYLILMPKITIPIELIHASPHLPSVTQVLHSLKPLISNQIMKDLFTTVECMK